MADIMGLMKKAQEMQGRMQEMQAELERLEVEGQSGGGVVRITLTAKGAMKSIAIDASMMKPEEKEIVEDLIIAAHEDARQERRAPHGGKDENRDRWIAAAPRHEAAVLGDHRSRWPNASPDLKSSV